MSSYGSFKEALLPPDVSAGFEVVQGDGVDVFRASNKTEERVRYWEDVQRTWTASYGMKGAAKLQKLLKFHRAVGGRAFGFRMRDWFDWTTNVDDCGFCSHPTPCDDLLADLRDLDRTPDAQGWFNVPIYRNHHFLGIDLRRRIFKPRCAHFRVALDGAEIPPDPKVWKIDPARGLVKFKALPAGKRLTWGGIYDTPVRFDMAEMRLSLQMSHLGASGQIALSELIREADVFPASADDEHAAMEAGDLDDLDWALRELPRLMAETMKALPQWPS